ncbi:hypothetical protein BDQ12DRAFT_728297 [Crucibulum laeve]|uniref:Uncharacterized protein n=1 Tax=Crucibulum laeve TaxID=68775 RepID=A0A5C3LJD6_9AGAR|nr:hypothetical protein BDQ12DRAFT_728297 [Crucibulum laeve]
MHGGDVELSSSGQLRVIRSDARRYLTVGNMKDGSTSTVIRPAMENALTALEAYQQSWTMMNYLSASLFLRDPEPALARPPIRSVPILGILDINQNMDRFILSAAKAYLNGYVPKDSDLPIGAFINHGVTATQQEERVALTASKLLLITTITLLFIAMILSPVICLGSPMQHRLPFDLESILAVIQQGGGDQPS